MEAIINIENLTKSHQSCIHFLEKLRWGKHPICPYCTDDNVYKKKNELRYNCRKCLRSFSVIVGTIFHGTHMPLNKWFLIKSYMNESGDSMSASEISSLTKIRRGTVAKIMNKIYSVNLNDKNTIINFQSVEIK